LQKYKSPGSDQIPAELIQAGGEILLSAINELINSVWNKEALPDQWKESTIVPFHKSGNKTDCNNYREIIEDHQCGFRRNRLTTDQIFCIRQFLRKKNGSSVKSKKMRLAEHVTGMGEKKSLVGKLEGKIRR
jgi:hypothetical protein